MSSNTAGKFSRLPTKLGLAQTLVVGMLGIAVLLPLGVAISSASPVAHTVSPSSSHATVPHLPETVPTVPFSGLVHTHLSSVSASTTQSSSSWAGYVAAGSTYQSAQATFVVPRVTTCGNPESTWADFWAGIDGFGGTTVEQSGVAAYCANGVTGYLAWTEMYPANPVTIPGFTVSAGDSVTTTTQYQQNGTYQLTVADNTTGRTSSVQASGHLANATAECIAEDPQLSPTTRVPYVMYSPVSFSSCLINGSSIAALNPIAVTDQTAGTVMASPSGLSGSAFTVTRSSQITPVVTGGDTLPPNAGQVTSPVVGIAGTPFGDGYWKTDAFGDVQAYGSAQYFGSMAGHALNKPIAHIVSTPDGKGYWLVASDGGTFTFGDAGFYGSMGSAHLNAPVVDLAPTTSGKGYWLVASDGGIFSFGDAVFQGSTGAMHLNQPIVGIATDTHTSGYWLVASDGGIFSFDAPFFGSTGSLRLNQPIVSMAPTASGGGYWFVAADGGIFSFGNAAFHGSLAGQSATPTVAMASANAYTGGYWTIQRSGQVSGFAAPTY